MYIISYEWENVLKHLYAEDINFKLEYDCPQMIITIKPTTGTTLTIRNFMPDEHDITPIVVHINDLKIYEGSDWFQINKILEMFRG